MIGGPTPAVPTPAADPVVTATMPTVAARDTRVDLTLRSATLARRVLRLTLQARETIRLDVVVARGATRLRHKTIAAVKTGTRAITLALPRTAAGARLTVRVTATDTAGNTVVTTRAVRSARAR